MTRLGRRGFLVGMLCISLLAAQSSRAPSSSGQKIASIHPGVISAGIYSNEFFDFSLEIPTGWKVADNTTLGAIQERNQRLLLQQPQSEYSAENSEVDSPLLIMGEQVADGSSQHHRSIQIECTDVSRRPGQATADEFLKYLVEASLQSDPTYDYSNTLEPVTLGGREFWKVGFTQKGSILWHGARLATIAEKHVLQFILFSPDENGLQDLEAKLRTVHFTTRTR